jgi:hypothetical protein
LQSVQPTKIRLVKDIQVEDHTVNGFIPDELSESFSSLKFFGSQRQGYVLLARKIKGRAWTGESDETGDGLSHRRVVVGSWAYQRREGRKKKTQESQIDQNKNGDVASREADLGAGRLPD